MHNNSPVITDNHLLAKTLDSPLAQDIKVSTASALIARGANIFMIDKSMVTVWMQQAAQRGQWLLVDFFVYQLSNLTVVRSSSGAPTEVVDANAFKFSQRVSNKNHQPTVCAYDDALLSQVDSPKCPRV
jgi:hypothetical protein